MKIILAAASAAILAAAPAGALEWQALGPRALGMGGAGVALSQGPVASYWNPASLGLATENAYGFQLPVGAHAALTGPVIAGANDLKNLRDACSTFPPGAGCTQANINATLAELNNPADGLRVDANAGGDFKIGRLAFFANGFLDAGAVPRVDTTHNLAAPASNPDSLLHNDSALVVKGARLLEFGAGYGRELPFAPGVFLGGNLKLMNASVGYASYNINQNNNGNSNIASQIKSSATTSSNIGVDVGVLWDLGRSFDGVDFRPRIGLTGRNLNNPKFTQPAAAAADGVSGRYAVNPQARLGAAISPFSWWNIAADVDLTRNLTPVDGVASRQFGVGTEINVFNRSWINIPLRFGASRNLAEAGAGTLVSAGAGLNFLHIIVDASATASPKTIPTQTQGKTTKIPTELGAALSVSLLFGGSEDDRTRPRGDDSQAAPPPESRDLPPAQADEVRRNAEKAQQELDKAGH